VFVSQTLSLAALLRVLTSGHLIHEGVASLWILRREPGRPEDAASVL
jgi:hypothetical protein